MLKQTTVQNKINSAAMVLVLVLLGISNKSNAQSPLSNDQYRFIEYYFCEIFEARKTDKLSLSLLNYLDVIKRWEPKLSLEDIISKEFMQMYLLPLQGWDTLISKQDFVEMRSHIDRLSNVTRLNQKELRIKRKNLLIKEDESKNRLNKSYSDYTTYRITPPVYNLKRDLILLYVENHCGIECGGGEFLVFKKSDKDGSFIFLGRLPLWVS